jgi:hypothetical protein
MSPEYCVSYLSLSTSRTYATRPSERCASDHRTRPNHFPLPFLRHRSDLLGWRFTTFDLVRETQAVQKLRKLTVNLDQLMQAGQGSWALGNVEVQDSSWSVIDREPHVEQPESHGWGDEEIHAIGSR